MYVTASIAYGPQSVWWSGKVGSFPLCGTTTCKRDTKFAKPTTHMVRYRVQNLVWFIQIPLAQLQSNTTQDVN